MENWWQKPITALKGIGSKRAEAFARLEIVTIGDLLNYYPRLDSYIDYSHLATFSCSAPSVFRPGALKQAAVF